MNQYDNAIVIIGSGLSGATLARKFAEDNKKVIIIDKRDHVGGNTYDYINEDGIRMSKYGAHIFHTSDEGVWNFVNRFTEFLPYEHRVLSCVDDELVPIPINITTVNKVLGIHLDHQKDFEKWQKNNPYAKLKVENSRDSALRRIGNLELYEKMIENYTFKQWNMKPEELEASVLERIPVRPDWNDRYFSDKYEGMPFRGYTYMVDQMLNHVNINVMLNTEYDSIKSLLTNVRTVFFTGKIDSYFDEKFGKLQYRSLRFEHETVDEKSYQSNAVINYPSKDVPYTRIIEHKKLYMQDSPVTTITKEFSTDEGEPYYPVPTQENRDIYDKYQKAAKKSKGVHFVGRLANYKYFNMDQAIRNALDMYEELKGKV